MVWRAMRIFFSSLSYMSTIVNQDEYVEVSDGAVSIVDNTVMEGFHNIQWLKVNVNIVFYK